MCTLGHISETNTCVALLDARLSNCRNVNLDCRIFGVPFSAGSIFCGQSAVIRSGDTRLTTELHALL